MSNVLNILQVATAVFLIVTILMQQRGTGLGGAFGGGAEVYSTKRGAEKVLFITTIVLATTFVLLGIIRLFV